MSDYPQANLPSSVFVAANTSTSAQEGLDESRELALSVASAAADRKAGDIVLLKVAEVSYLADYFVLATGYSRVQVRAIAQAVEDKVEEKFLRRPLRSEGKAEGSWVLQDYGDVMVHIMMAKEREFYNLEAFWGHAEKIELPDDIALGDEKYD